MQVWGVNFGDKLAIREASQHGQCSACVRHKMLIRKLSGDVKARGHQLRQYEAHLLQQYRDRTVYWSNRSMSRIPMQPSGTRKLCIVTDAIDHNKFRYPRSRIFVSKEFSSTVRPAMDMTCVLCHGHHLMLALSEPFVPKNSSWCTELLSHMLHKLGSSLDVRQCEVHIQSDNCSRETKNNTLTRWAALLTSTHRVKRIQLDFLMTGHSHEDIDQFFSMVSNKIEASPEVHCPSDFVRLLEGWLSDASIREHEPFRSVLKIDRVRDWRFDCNLMVLLPFAVKIVRK